MMHSLRLRPDISEGQFRVYGQMGNAKIRVIELLNQNITAERVMSLDARNGYIEADVEQDLLKVAMFDRHEQTGKITMGFLKGFGAKIGAIGITTDLDENTLLIVGSHDADMAVCANVLIESGGGIAVVGNGQVLDKIEFPVGGIFSLNPWRQVGQQLRRIHRYLREQGSLFERPYTLFVFFLL